MAGGAGLGKVMQGTKRSTVFIYMQQSIANGGLLLVYGPRAADPAVSSLFASSFRTSGIFLPNFGPFVPNPVRLVGSAWLGTANQYIPKSVPKEGVPVWIPRGEVGVVTRGQSTYLLAGVIGRGDAGGSFAAIARSEHGNGVTRMVFAIDDIIRARSSM